MTLVLLGRSRWVTTRGAPAVVVISRSLGRALFPDRDPIGQVVHFATLRPSAIEAALSIGNMRGHQSALAQGGSEDLHDFELTGATAHTVIGVAADVRLTGDLSIDAGDPVVYVDYRQFREHVITRSQMGFAYEPLLELGRVLFRTRDVPAPALAAARTRRAAPQRWDDGGRSLFRGPDVERRRRRLHAADRPDDDQDDGQPRALP